MGETNVKLSWEWEKTKDNWFGYSTEIADLINAACVRKKQVNFDESGVKFSIDFEKLIQKNVHTGFERRCRCVVECEEGRYVWQWLDENNKWQFYGPSVVVQLEEEFVAKNTNLVKFSAGNRAYTVDLTKMVQSNDSTSVTRRIERVRSGTTKNAKLPALTVDVISSKRQKTILNGDVDEAQETKTSEESGGKKSRKTSVEAQEEKKKNGKKGKSTDDSMTMKNGRRKSTKRRQKMEEDEDEKSVKEGEEEDKISLDEEEEMKPKKSNKQIKVEEIGQPVAKKARRVVLSDDEEETNEKVEQQDVSHRSTKKSTRIVESSDGEESDEDKPLNALIKSTKPKKRVASDDDEEDLKKNEEETKKTISTKKAGNKKSSKSTSEKKKSTKSSASEKKSTIRTVVVKGKAPVDVECTQKLGKAHVYYEGNNVYDCILNQTNVQNNNNKYYIIQLLEDDGAKKYSVWLRWGRVGYSGQNNLIACGSDLEKAKETFCKKFEDKTKNEWCDRKKFRKVAGKYDLVDVDYAAGGDGDVEMEPAKNKDEKSVASNLNEAVQALLKLICDVRAMESAVREMKYDADKAPLGKLTSGQIKAGYLALKRIEKCIEDKSYGKGLVEACNEFYTRIPHCFGMKTPPLIRDKRELKEKIQLLETLNEIEVAIRTLKSEVDDDKLHPLDRHYVQMKCDLTALDRDSDTFHMIEKYMKNTHAATHNTYTMKLVDVFDIEKAGEKDKFNDVGNKMLLWHGSRLTNWYGILSQGLRIAPPEAPATGYMFGKGVYFADVSSKSTNYCFATRQKNVGLAVLCEVALGQVRECTAADYNADKLPPNFHSTKGLGRVAPDPRDVYVTNSSCLVPYGKLKEATTSQTYALNYNEYVVYDTSQIRMRYLLKVEFVFPQ